MIATTTKTGPRRLDFLSIGETFDDEVDRRTMEQFLRDEDSDESDCDSETEYNVKAADEILNIGKSR